jgi:hypothetical protein
MGPESLVLDPGISMWYPWYPCHPKYPGLVSYPIIKPPDLFQILFEPRFTIDQETHKANGPYL